jgi:hypothetical protein
MRLVKVRQSWAWGYSKWQLVEVPEDVVDTYGSVGSYLEERYGSVGSYLEERYGNDNGSDKYRGVQWSAVRKVPRGYVLDKIERLQKSIRSDFREIHRLKSISVCDVEKTCRWCAHHTCSTYACKECRKSKTRSRWTPMYTELKV